MYLLLYENLHFYSRVELKLKIIHRLSEFSQSQWLKPSIEFKSEKGIEA